MNNILRPVGAVILALAVSLPAWASGDFGIGGGVYYNKMLGSLDKDKFRFDEDYFSYLLSAKYQFLSFLAAEALLDYYPGSGDVDYTLKPMGTVLLGDFINVGVGINQTYMRYKIQGEGSTGKWSNLSYHFKAGVQIPLADVLWLNADAYYFVDELKDIQDFNKDYLTFGARVHFRF